MVQYRREKGNKSKLTSWEKLGVLEYRAAADLFRPASRYRICTPQYFLSSPFWYVNRGWIEWRKEKFIKHFSQIFPRLASASR